MLITSISGIRGTIGGTPGENLTPVDVVGFASAYGTFLRSQNSTDNLKVVIGRDARPSGYGIAQLVIQTLRSMGIHIVDCDLVPTPTVAMVVRKHEAHGGLIITASHNPKEYNGIKMLNGDGEFLSRTDGEEILNIIKQAAYEFARTDDLGSYTSDEQAVHDHINDILDLEILDVEKIREAKFTVVLDAINSVGGIAVPLLLEKLDVVYVPLNIEPTGMFAHKPEPLEENLSELKQHVTVTGADLGIAVDPDTDRLVLVSDTGDMFGEENTLVICTDAVLSHTPGSVVNNLSSSRATSDIAGRYGNELYSSAVGEKNVVTKMKEVNAVIGGEGSGGVIYPALHYGRDALVGIALVLNLLAQRETSLSELKKEYPSYVMIKDKVSIEGLNVADIISSLTEQYHDQEINTDDGLRIDFENSWVHLRASNTEPIMRIITEAQTQEQAQKCIEEIKQHI
jgi:phosphomannomutase